MSALHGLILSHYFIVHSRKLPGLFEIDFIVCFSCSGIKSAPRIRPLCSCRAQVILGYFNSGRGDWLHLLGMPDQPTTPFFFLPVYLFSCARQFPNPVSWVILLVPLVLQLYNPRKKICRERLTGLIGHGWRSAMKHKYNADKPTLADAEANKTAAALQKRFNDMINTELRKIGVNTTRPSILNLVMASAFEPDRPIVGMLHRVFDELQVIALSPGLCENPRTSVSLNTCVCI